MDAATLIAQSVEAMNAGDLSLAERKLRHALVVAEIVGEDAINSRIALARLLNYIGDSAGEPPPEALSVAKEAVDLAEQYKDDHTQRFRYTALVLYSRMCFGASMWDECVRITTTLLELSSVNSNPVLSAEFKLTLAGALSERGNPEQSIPIVESALSVLEKNSSEPDPIGRFVLASALQKCGRFEEAIRLYQMLIEMMPDKKDVQRIAFAAEVVNMQEVLFEKAKK